MIATEGGAVVGSALPTGHVSEGASWLYVSCANRQDLVWSVNQKYRGIPAQRAAWRDSARDAFHTSQPNHLIYLSLWVSVRRMTVTSMGIRELASKPTQDYQSLLALARGAVLARNSGSNLCGDYERTIET